MSKKLFMGVDPGRTGAVGIIDEDLNFVDIIDCPIHKTTKRIDIIRFIDKLKTYKGKITACVLERACSMPQDAKPRVFNYGQTVGVFKALLDFCEFKFIEIDPRTWKKAFHLGPDKELSLTKARKDIKGSGSYLKRHKDHNRAEALLLALYCFLLFKRENKK